MIGSTPVLHAFWSVAAGRSSRFGRLHSGHVLASAPGQVIAVGFGHVGRGVAIGHLAEGFGQSGDGFRAGALRQSGFGKISSSESCRAPISVVAWTPNNSFKPTPLRGAA